MLNLFFNGFLMVRLIGLEPTRRKAPDPKSGVSTNFTTGAGLRPQRYIFFSDMPNY
jgi:hypothetical protein